MICPTVTPRTTTLKTTPTTTSRRPQTRPGGGESSAPSLTTIPSVSIENQSLCLWRLNEKENIYHLQFPFHFSHGVHIRHDHSHE